MIEHLTEYLHRTSTFHETTSSRTTFDSRDSVDNQTSAGSSDTSPDLRVGAFNVRIFGQKKVSNGKILNILVQVVPSIFLFTTYA